VRQAAAVGQKRTGQHWEKMFMVNLKYRISCLGPLQYDIKTFTQNNFKDLIQISFKGKSNLFNYFSIEMVAQF